MLIVIWAGFAVSVKLLIEYLEIYGLIVKEFLFDFEVNLMIQLK